ncbi:MAG: hypothetical protein Q8R04_06360 [Nanoarchaeota archaeon]|nr:hypothetical protein [Nanoarchaeota archaeon]
MGFLKFLKREKKEDALEDLDLPPSLPPLEGFEENVPELPDFPDLPEEKFSGTEETPEFEFPEKEEKMGIGKESTMPDFPAFPEPEEKPLSSTSPLRPTRIPERMPSISQPMPEPEQTAQEEAKFTPPDAYPRMERRLFAQEKRILMERPNLKTIYVRVDKFKATLGSINLVRSDLRKSEEALNRLENIKNAKDKSFEKVKSLLDDLQRKFIFVDKTLFKGE